MVTGATHLVHDRNLATVVARHAMQDPGGFGRPPARPGCRCSRWT
jgi:hypothetical protein